MNILDIVFIFVIIFCTVISVKKGFLISVLNLAAVILAGVSARILSTPVAQYIYDGFIKSGIINTLKDTSGEITNSIKTATDQLPDIIMAIGARFGLVNADGTLAFADSAITDIYSIEDQIIKPVIVGILSIIVLSILFFILSILFRLIVLMIRKGLKNKKLKLLNTSDAVLGGIFGFIRSAFPVTLICLILIFIASNSNSESFINLVDQSMFCQVIQKLF